MTGNLSKAYGAYCVFSLTTALCHCAKPELSKNGSQSAIHWQRTQATRTFKAACVAKQRYHGVKQDVSLKEQKHDDHYEIKVMRVRTKGIIHVKNLAKMKDLTKGEGVMDMVFDWYALSLANIVLAWRKGGTHLVSTFVHSAARLSGTTARTSYKKELGKGGVGTLGTQLQQNRHGGYFWNPFWLYGFMEDYAIPEDRRNRYRGRHKL